MPSRSEADARETILRRIRIGWADCWDWTGATLYSGRGRMTAGGKVQTAYRVAYEAFIGPIPAGMWVLHRCDNPRCCNPEHLYLGTAADNSAAMKMRGRGANQNSAKVMCIRGHVLIGANLWIQKKTGKRQCRECGRLREKQRHAK